MYFEGSNCNLIMISVLIKSVSGKSQCKDCFSVCNKLFRFNVILLFEMFCCLEFILYFFRFMVKYV